MLVISRAERIVHGLLNSICLRALFSARMACFLNQMNMSTPSMMILSGAPSLSAFRRKKLLSTLQKSVPSLVSVYAEYVHFADLTRTSQR